MNWIHGIAPSYLYYSCDQVFPSVGLSKGLEGGLKSYLESLGSLMYIWFHICYQVRSHSM